MKKTLPVIATLTSAALALSACAAGDAEGDASPDPTTGSGIDGGFGAPADVEALQSVDWAVDDAGVPVLEFDAPIELSATAALRVADGDGEELELGQSITLDYTVVNGADGSTLYSTYDVGMGETLTLEEGMLDPVLWQALDGASVGADILYGTFDGGLGEEDPSTAIMALTVSDAVTPPEPLDRAEGTAVDPVDGLPVVTLDDEGKPSVEIPDEEAPADLVAQPLIEGEGSEVVEGQTVTVHYTGWVWDGGDQFDSSWDRGEPSTFGLITGQLIGGWVQGLAGQTVGSQVLLVVPAELGYGEQGSGENIPPGATLVFVVDILAAY